MLIPDLFRQGLERGWQVQNASQLEEDLTLEADIAIVGSGAGGATSAEILSAAGFRVLLIEEGGLFTSSDFRMQERSEERRVGKECRTWRPSSHDRKELYGLITNRSLH